MAVSKVSATTTTQTVTLLKAGILRASSTVVSSHFVSFILYFNRCVTSFVFSIFLFRRIAILLLLLL